MTGVARLICAGWALRLKEMHRSGLFVFAAVIQPLLLATLIYYLFQAGHRPRFTFHIGLGAGMMGLWSATLYGAATTIALQRWKGTLEYLIATPTRFYLIVVQFSLASATLGVYSLGAALLWTRVAFGEPFAPVHGLLFALSVLVTVAALAALGLLMSASFILVYRSTPVFANLLEYPLWVMSGALVSISALPGWLEQPARLFPPTWGFRAMREAVFGGEPLRAMGVCLALSLPVLVLGIFCARVLERRARTRAELSLA